MYQQKNVLDSILDLNMYFSIVVIMWSRGWDNKNKLTKTFGVNSYLSDEEVSMDQGH